MKKSWISIICLFLNQFFVCVCVSVCLFFFFILRLQFCILCVIVIAIGAVIVLPFVVVYRRYLVERAHLEQFKMLFMFQ